MGFVNKSSIHPAGFADRMAPRLLDSPIAGDNDHRILKNQAQGTVIFPFAAVRLEINCGGIAP
jgi:hypothetical protein